MEVSGGKRFLSKQHPFQNFCFKRRKPMSEKKQKKSAFSGRGGQWPEVNERSRAGEDLASPPLPLLPERDHQTECFSSGVPRPAASVSPSPGRLPEIASLRPHPRPTEKESPGGGPALCSNKPSREFRVLQSKNHDEATAEKKVFPDLPFQRHW